MKLTPWSIKDVNFLKDNYKRLSYGQIALKIDRLPQNVNSYAYQIGLRKGKKHDHRFSKNKSKPIENKI